MDISNPKEVQRAAKKVWDDLDPKFCKHLAIGMAMLPGIMPPSMQEEPSSAFLLDMVKAAVQTHTDPQETFEVLAALSMVGLQALDREGTFQEMPREICDCPNCQLRRFMEDPQPSNPADIMEQIFGRGQRMPGSDEQVFAMESGRQLDALIGALLLGTARRRGR